MKIALNLNPSWRPGLPPGDRRLWILRTLALRREHGAKTVWHLELLWKRAVAGVLAIAAVGYFAAVTVLFVWWDRLPGNEITWLDIATAPVRWEHLKEKRGATAISAALLRLKEKDYVEAFYGLRVGLARAPGHVTGRVTLARLMFQSDPHGALTLLEEGLRYSDDPELLRALFAAFVAQQAQQHALELSARLLSAEQKPPLGAPARRIVANTRAALLVAAGDAAGAEQLLATLPAGATTAEERRTVRLRVTALNAIGRTAEAQQLFATLPRNSADDFRLEAELAIQAGDATALESALRHLKALQPGQPQPLVFAFSAWHRMKRPTLRDAAEQEFFRFFSRNDSALQLFAATAVQLDLPEAVRHVEQVSVANRFSAFAYRVHLTEIALRHGDVDEAFRRLRDWESVIESLPSAQRFYPEYINRLVRASVAGGEQQVSGLVNHLSDLRGRATPAMYQLATAVLSRAGNPVGARDVLELGLRLYPLSDNLLTLRPSVAAAAEQRNSRDAAQRVPVVETASSIVSIPKTSAGALEQLDAAIASESFGSASDLLRAIRATKPAWLPESEDALARREVEVALLTQDSVTARALLRRYLERRRPEEDQLHVAELAARLLARGREAEARLVRDEMLAAHASPSASAALERLALKDDRAASVTSAATALAEIDRALQQSRPGDALRLLDFVREKKPAWLADARAELGVREVRVWLALDQRPSALAALKDVVIRPGASRAAAFRLVRELLADGQQESALILAREIVRLLPEDKAAASLLREVEAPQPGE